jgi:hypothetical protein
MFQGDSSRRDLILPPVRLDADHIVTARVQGGRFNPYGSGSLDLLLLAKQDDWQPEPSLRLPIATRRLFAVAPDSLMTMNSGDLAITDRTNILQAAGLGEANDGQASPAVQDANSLTTRLANLLRMQGMAPTEFASVLPPGIALVQPARVVVAADGGSLVLYTFGRVVRLEPTAASNQSVWTLAAERDLEGEPAQSAVLAGSGSLLFLSRGEGPPQVLDRETLQTVAELPAPPRGRSVLSATNVADDGRFVVVTSDGRCHLIDANKSSDRFGQQLDFREVESVWRDPLSRSLLVVHHVDQIDRLDMDTLSVLERIRPTLVGWRLVNRYVITPLRTVTPQTGELGQTVAAIIGGKSAVAINQDEADQADVLRFKILRPVLSCAGFVALMLLVGSVYFARKDF